jgi:hypothetical protein
MRYARIVLLSAAAIGFLPFATPASAQLGHPSGCVSCSPVEVTPSTQDYYREGAPLIGAELKMGFPPGAAALAPETSVAGPKSHKRLPHGARWRR